MGHFLLSHQADELFNCYKRTSHVLRIIRLKHLKKKINSIILQTHAVRTNKKKESNKQKKKRNKKEATQNDTHVCAKARFNTTVQSPFLRAATHKVRTPLHSCIEASLGRPGHHSKSATMFSSLAFSALNTMRWLSSALCLLK